MMKKIYRFFYNRTTFIFLGVFSLFIAFFAQKIKTLLSIDIYLPDIQTRFTISAAFIAFASFIDTVQVQKIEYWNKKKIFFNTLINELRWNQEQVSILNHNKFNFYSILYFNNDNNVLPFFSNDVLREAISKRADYFYEDWFLLDSMRIFNNANNLYIKLINGIDAYKYSNVTMLNKAIKRSEMKFIDNTFVNKIKDRKLKTWFIYFENLYENLRCNCTGSMEILIDNIINKLEFHLVEIEKEKPIYKI